MATVARRAETTVDESSFMRVVCELVIYASVTVCLCAYHFVCSFACLLVIVFVILGLYVGHIAPFSVISPDLPPSG